ncbi:hypothetical protein A7K94_0208660 [Modestobacter sp. VKM Ac-2676]|nr:hypothetical protein A7K94_0208660 [Modestobacter sp. VKM Ac-2676]
MVMTDVRVRAERLPGIGWRHTLPADVRRQVMVVVEPRLDEPLTTVRLSAEHAAVLLAPQRVTGRFRFDACLLGVICDATPQLVETDEQRGVQGGDKLVVAARRSQLEHLRNAV